MKINKMTFLGFYLNGAALSGDYPHITKEAMRKQIRAKTVFPYLRKELGNVIDISLFSAADTDELSIEWENIENTTDEARKMCLDADNGLGLLVAYLLQGIQHRVGSQDVKSLCG